MRPTLFGVMVALLATGAFAQQIQKRDIDPRGADENASGGVTAPRPAFSRDASASQALFQRLDKNRDGYLTGTEMTSTEALAANWIAVDRDGDGRVSPAEFTAVTGTETARR